MNIKNEQPAANDEPVIKDSFTTEVVKGSTCHDNTPGHKNKMNQQKQLAMLIKGIEAGEVRTLGKAAIKRFVNCADNRAAWLQMRLVEKGIAVTVGRTVKLAA